MPDSRTEFDLFSKALRGLPLSHVWRGYGAALFLEFGTLRQHFLPDGAAGHPMGQMGLMIQCCWRIEGSRTILCGSSSDESKWARFFDMLLQGTVTDVSLFGRLPEIDVSLSNRMHVVSFSTTDGQPQWALFHRELCSSVASKNGALVIESADTSRPPPVLH